MKQRRKYRPQSRKRAAPPYANTFFGFNYVMLNLPFIWWGKVGFTGKLKGVQQRAESVSKPAPGILIPVMVCPLIMPWFIEQFILWLIEPFRARYYKGNGHTEAVNIAGAGVAWLIYALIWLGYLELAHQNGLSPVGAVWVLNKFAIIAKIFVQKLALLV